MSGQEIEVSAIVTTYQGDNPEFVRLAVESFLTQSHPVGELLLVLDGPIEGENRSVVDDLAASDARVRVIGLAENKGPSTARNAGIDEARGEYVLLLDSDDLAHETRVERQLAFMRDANADVVGSFYEVIDEAGEVWERRTLPCTSESIRRNLWLVNPIAPSMMMARTEVLREHRFPPAIRYGEDYDLCIRLLQQGYVVLNQPEYLTQFRTNRGFTDRRRGWIPFKADLNIRLRGVGLCPFYLRPLVIFPALALVGVRLLPPSIIAQLYRVRSLLRFGK